MAATEVEDLLRELAPQVLGALVRRYGHFDTAEDAVQEALLAAAAQWPTRRRAGQPARLADHGRLAPADRPAAQRAGPAAPRGRRRPVGAARAVAGARPPTGRRRRPTTRSILLFLCCHPSLSPASQIALTLRAVGGLTTAEIARAFLVPEATMTRRISRAKQRIKDSGLPFAHAAGRRARASGSTRCCTCST